ncbi:AbrB/MazE/SpoVT family DNA-binding domain-containing protein [Oscillatoria sp. CS-180]|uniref:AbrB/MazE/SpoVT family DNA-binding domain-containing protein n=1 Tax=Oscillatoria sp. CS-180 TaxID=3021720 RepID=UPI00232CE022|nr:AbrB/MazE/SpoVT family DNA-binding domain-containing protein [Oscillatoria sp. CS-180]MDB9525302.1 AbrB/MazE/SpoVT family DNA-binding domain-containing protein [Oscillatoria sp. CS-180]
MPASHHTTLHPIGESQVLTIPPELALSGNEVLIRKEGERLIVEPVKPKSLVSLLNTLQDIPDPFPDIDADLLPLDDVIV